MTLLLRDWQSGKEGALDQLMPLIYSQLRGLAQHYMRSERANHTLGPTAIVNEAYLRLATSEPSCVDRVHLYAVAATVMRHILLDWARSSRRMKRGSGAVMLELNDSSSIAWDDPANILEVDRLLQNLCAFDPRKAKITEMIFFGGMTYDETAQFLGISAVTVHRELKMAKAWMFNQLRPRDSSIPE